MPGAGELHVTSQGGRNVRLGRLLGLGHCHTAARALMAGETLEGAETVRVMSQALPRLQARGLVAPEELPLMLTLNREVGDGQATALVLGGSSGQETILTGRRQAGSLGGHS